MKKQSLTLVMAALFCIGLHSCGSDDDLQGDMGGATANARLAGTKWTATNWDYGLGDDWVSTLDETYSLYFYSQTEGLMYYGRKDFDTDFGSSSDRQVAHFTYSVNGNIVQLDYLTSPLFNGFGNLILNDSNVISVNGYNFRKEGQMTASDNSWLVTLHGQTGACRWYHDLQSAVYIIGEGAMADYTSYTRTPWATGGRTVNTVVVDDGVTTVGAYAFATPSVSGADLPRSLTRIGDKAFQGATLSSVNLPDGITTIGESAFADCTYLRNVYMPSDVTEIGDFAFSSCQSASLTGTKSLRQIGQHAFAGCEVTRWTDSEVLEEIGGGAFTDCSFSELTLPASLRTLGHLAFSDTGISTIRIGSGLTSVTGTPFYVASRGSLYMDQNAPLTLTDDLIDPDRVGNWTLYVPMGSKSAYARASYWKEFRTILESEDLKGDGSVVEDEDEVDELPEYEPLLYTIDGKTFKMIKVGRFCIMQTELPPSAVLEIGSKRIGRLDASADGAVIKTEFRNFLNTLREETGLPFRLPSKSEWQLAANEGYEIPSYTYSGSNDIDDVAWYRDNSNHSVQRVATKEPNELDIYDMSGNYAELCNDSEDLYNVDGPFCGGSWKDYESACKVTSWKNGSTSGNIPGLNIKEKNAFDASYITVRLVYSVRD